MRGNGFVRRRRSIRERRLQERPLESDVRLVVVLGHAYSLRYLYPAEAENQSTA